MKTKLVVTVVATATEERVWPDIAAGGDDGKVEVGRAMADILKLATTAADEERA